MPSIAQIQSQLKKFDTAARKASGNKDTEAAMKHAWKRIFSTELEDASAKSFLRYYRDMRSRSKTLRGGASLTPAPLSYQMTPGANVQVYGNFPVEAGMDPASIRNLDVYFQDSLTKGCGIENSSRQVPATMGSNKVGGSRRSSRKTRKTLRKRKESRAHRSRAHRSRAHRSRTHRSRAHRSRTHRSRAHRSRRSVHRGGNLLTSLATHPYLSTSPSNTIQNASVSWAGSPQPPSGNPVVPAWGYATNGSERLINPGLITPIGSDMTKLASPAPWQTTH